MSPAGARAASCRVLKRLADPPKATWDCPSEESDQVRRISEIGNLANDGQGRPGNHAMSQEELDGATRQSANRSSRDDSGPSNQDRTPRIRVQVSIGTSYEEIQESVVRQVYELEGTQFRTAIALGITPETVSRIMRRSDNRTISSPQVPEAWRVVRLPEPAPGMDWVSISQTGPNTAQAASSESSREEEVPGWASGDKDDAAPYD